MDAAPYDNVEFPIRRQLGTPATWPGSDHVIMSIKSPTPKTPKPKTESKLSPVLEVDGSEFTEEQAELPSVQDQRQTAQVTNLRGKKETEITANKGVTLVNSNQVGRPPTTLKAVTSSSPASTSETHTLVPFGAKTTIATTKTATTTPTSVIPSSTMDKNGKIGFVIVDEPRPFNQDFSRLDLNPSSQTVLGEAYTKQRKFYRLNDRLLAQGEDMRQDVWQAKGRPGELLTYEQLLQGMLEEGEVLVLGGAWLYFTHLDFLDKEGKTKVKPSIGKGRICLTDRKLLILSAEVNEDAALSEFGDGSPASQSGYKLELSKYNRTFYQNVPLGCFLGVELSASVGSSLESRLTEQEPLCGGLCSCLGIARCSTTWRSSRPMPVPVNTRTIRMGISMPPWHTETNVVVYIHPEMPLTAARDFVAQIHHHAPLLH
ncbi:uncharacterized protein LOC110440591 isoform X2 [Mizuhopecten yessoensis]|uniref:Uncharacterized protein n=1 Tax=Mizuhopecten yessoensis TaxID=6573 RepID=A0A210PKS6_MIZYE|nr:uncharacterized protein LOC110440591 isoform X2 [Mizuhopecten yessoensis]OWF37089.1 hypothetical protein KP79_PYT09779 [Mizuhopecten yessoensis]